VKFVHRPMFFVTSEQLRQYSLLLWLLLCCELIICTNMHGKYNVKFSDAQQTKTIYKFQSLKEKIHIPMQQYDLIRYAERNS
jgi:hypothetical protein